MIVALDTGFLFQLADVENDAWNLYSRLLEQPGSFHLITTPTVNDVLELLARTSQPLIVDRVRRVWRGLSGQWRIANVTLTESQKKLAWVCSYHFRDVHLLEEEDRLEAQILGEAVLIADLLLASADSPLHRLDAKRLVFEAQLLCGRGLVVFTPRELSPYLSA